MITRSFLLITISSVERGLVSYEISPSFSALVVTIDPTLCVQNHCFVCLLPSICGDYNFHIQSSLDPFDWGWL